ncbi:PilZ domain-containing protein [Hyphomonas pacifica]|uniref:Uncharacterized protein n=1 Tax=Hyphomonas pacifica TaxID=1280941 RepID=A0A062TPM1_9PROT|nr:PilZ domain-containing protein [Hyphomonas pacifica]KCZ48340.1 hypothetical protein HY2_03825 [Hyphomonas pacifica]RAN31652.1 hypothetical protein HY3_03520 [Hyphomonas pacifica]RAN32045.1 hypothetical protein HY11_05585 [Hyphomonas pacifica]
MSKDVPIRVGQDGAPVDLRRSLRVHRQVAGRIVLEDMSQARSVVIRNISMSGAALTVGEWPGLPNTFHLLMRTGPGGAASRLHCVVRWKIGPVIGVAFSEALPAGLLRSLTGVSEVTLSRAG